MCDVHVSENGKIVISTKSYHSDALERLGTPEKTIRGRVKMEKQNLVFEPYAEASRRPTYQKKAVVGSTTIAVTDGNVKLSLVLSRNYSKDMLTRLIEAEVEEVIRRIKEDLYDYLVRGQQTTDKVAFEREQRLLAGSAEHSNFNNVNRQQTEGGAA